MTIEEQLIESASVMAGLTAERDDLRVTVEKLTVGAAAELEAVKADNATKDATIADLLKQVADLSASKAVVSAQVEQLEANKVTASKEAAKIAASVGVVPVSLPTEAPASAEAVSHLATFLSLPMGSKERSDYFAAHKEAIIKGAL